MVQRGATRFIRFHYSALVELERSAVGIENRGHRLVHQHILHSFWVSPDRAPGLYLSNDYVLIVLAGALSSSTTRLIRVVRLEHGAVVTLELPSVLHPGALAAPSPVIDRA